MDVIVALDQGTTSSRAILFDHEGAIVEVAQKEFTQIFPKPGWVEHNPLEILNTQFEVMESVIRKPGYNIKALGITNQRETVVIWDKKTGKAVYNAIVWQCRRTAPFCEELKEEGWEEKIKDKTGLPIDAYFSGTKVKWILDNVEGVRERAEKGELLFGTIDSWLIWHLTGGKVHVTDYTNASRTLLYNIYDLKWDDEILERFGIPKSMLPEVKNSSDDFGTTEEGIPITGIAGDQQAALFGQACFSSGDVKNTYGTGCFTLMHTGETPIKSKNGLLTTIAIGLDGKVEYALEGSVFIGGAIVQWLRDELKMIDSSSEIGRRAGAVPNSNGAYIVPAFAGLGSPYWDMYARGTIVGLTRGVNKNHILRAAEESIAFQSLDLIKAMVQDSGNELKEMKVDGGASMDSLLMQIQADFNQGVIVRPDCVETTAMGAAFLAGLKVGFWKDKSDIENIWRLGAKFYPKMNRADFEEHYKGWKKAVSRAKDWAEE